MKIIDRTTHSQRSTDRKPRIIEFVEEQTGKSFKVHRHVDYPETWLVSSIGLCDKVDLKTNDFDKAVKEAAVYIKKCAEKEIQQLMALVSDIEVSLIIKQEESSNND